MPNITTATYEHVPVFKGRPVGILVPESGISEDRRGVRVRAVTLEDRDIIERLEAKRTRNDNPKVLPLLVVEGPLNFNQYVYLLDRPGRNLMVRTVGDVQDHTYSGWAIAAAWVLIHAPGSSTANSIERWFRDRETPLDYFRDALRLIVPEEWWLCPLMQELEIHPRT